MSAATRPYLLAIDKGTSEIKCVLFDSIGNEVAVAHEASSTLTPSEGRHEEDPDQVWRTVAALVRRVMQQSSIDPREIAGIGVTAHMGGLILLDHEMRPLRTNILWDDSRAAEIVERWQGTGLLEELFEIGGQALLPGLAVPLLLWLKRNDPASLSGASHICATKDYIVLKLTGRLGTDETDAGWMPGDVRNRRHSKRVLELCGIEDLAHLFPDIRASEQVVGSLPDNAAHACGLRSGIPVVAGLGDANASTIGVGAVQPGQAASIIGTSLLNNLVLAGPALAPKGIGFLLPTVAGRWLRMLPNTGGGSVNLRWLAETAYRGCPDPYQVMDEEVLEEPLGARGVYFHPYVNPSGVVAPFYHLGARAQFTAISVTTTRETLARAVFEGIAFAIRDCYSATPSPIDEVRLSGGAARSPVLSQIVADVLGKPVIVTQGAEAAAKGASMAAAVGIGLAARFEDAAETFVKIRRVFNPNPENHAKYSERFPHFRSIRQSMTTVWTELSASRRRAPGET